jgi:hypothetical protein
MRSRRAIGALAIAFLLWGSSAAAAPEKEREEPSELPWDRGYIQLGGFLASTESGFRIGASNLGLGIDINVETFLGLDEATTAFRLDGGLRFTRNLRHGIDFSWFSLDRTGVNDLTYDVEIPDGPTLPTGFTVSSIFNVDILKVRYDYSALLDKRINLEVGGGLYVMPMRFGFGEIDEERTEESITAPLPVLSISFNFVLSPKWRLRQSLDFLFLRIKNFEGSVVDLNLALETLLTQRFGIGFGVEALDIEIKADSDTAYPGVDFVGSVGFAYTGVQFYLRGRF